MLGTGSPTSVHQNYLNDLWEHRVLGLPQSFKLGRLGLVLLNGGAHFENHWWSAPHRSYISVALIIMTAFDSIFLLWKHRVYSITVPHNSARLYSGQMLPPFYGLKKTVHEGKLSPLPCWLLGLSFLLRIYGILLLSKAYLVAPRVKNLSAMREMWVQSLDQEDPLEEGIATHSSILA